MARCSPRGTYQRLRSHLSPFLAVDCASLPLVRMVLGRAEAAIAARQATSNSSSSSRRRSHTRATRAWSYRVARRCLGLPLQPLQTAVTDGAGWQPRLPADAPTMSCRRHPKRLLLGTLSVVLLRECSRNRQCSAPLRSQWLGRIVSVGRRTAEGEQHHRSFANPSLRRSTAQQRIAGVA